jgi:cysteinyl-tRNA synthetase
MSKSLGNVRTGRAFIEEYNGEVLKFMVLASHYRSPIDFSQQQTDRAIFNAARFYSSLAHATSLLQEKVNLVPVPEAFLNVIKKAEEGIEKALDDDFNTPLVMAEFFDVLKHYNAISRTPGKVKPEQVAVAETYLAWLKKQGEVLAIFQEEPSAFLKKLDDILLRRKQLSREAVEAKVKERSKARAAKDFAKSDLLRAELVQMGISIQDTLSGTTWEVDKTVT